MQQLFFEEYKQTSIGYNNNVKITYETYKLKNGMQILLISSRNTYSVNISASTRFGSALENSKNTGLTHFVEHMALSATKKYPTKRLFNETKEFNGGSANASTSDEFVSYNISLPNRKLNFGIDLMNEILYNCTFNPDYIEKERNVILDELSKYEDDVYYRNSRYAFSNLLAYQSGYAQEIGGTKDTVRSFTKRQLQAHYKKINSPENILLTIAGNFNIDEAKDLINSYFAPLKSQKIKIKYPEEELKKGKILIKNDKKTDLVIHTSIFQAKDGSALTTYETVLLYLIRLILTGPSTSRLFKRLREEEGLLYNVDSGLSIYSEFSMLEISFEVPPHLYKKTFDIYMEEMEKFYEKGITEKELKHYKEYLINRNLIDFDNFHRNAVRIRNSIFYNKEVFTVEQMNKTIKSFTTREINAYIRTLFKMKNSNHIAYGNTNEETSKILSNSAK